MRRAISGRAIARSSLRTALLAEKARHHHHTRRLVCAASFVAALQREQALARLPAAERWPFLLLLLDQRLLQLQDLLQLLGGCFADVREAAAWLASGAGSWPGGRGAQAWPRGHRCACTC